MYFPYLENTPVHQVILYTAIKKTQGRVTSLWQTKYHCDRQKIVNNKGAN